MEPIFRTFVDVNIWIPHQHCRINLHDHFHPFCHSFGMPSVHSLFVYLDYDCDCWYHHNCMWWSHSHNGLFWKHSYHPCSHIESWEKDNHVYNNRCFWTHEYCLRCWNSYYWFPWTHSSHHCASACFQRWNNDKFPLQQCICLRDRCSYKRFDFWGKCVV